MLKFVVSYGPTNVFTLELLPIFDGEGEVDMGKTMKHVMSIVGEGARVEAV